MFKKFSLFVASFIIATISFGFGGDPNTEITSGELKEHVKYLSSDELAGRFPGTPGMQKAEDYIIEQFKSYGIKPAGDNGTFIQNFEMITSVDLGTNNSFSADINGKDESFTVGHDFTPMGFTQNTTVSGNLVFVGYGISAESSGYDDYKDINVDGKIVVIMRYTPYSNDPHNQTLQQYAPLIVKTITAKEKKAAGIIFVTGPLDDEEDGLVALSFSNAYKDAGIPVINITRNTLDKILAPTGKNIAGIQKQINDSGAPSSFDIPDVTVNITADVEPRTVTTSNIIGILEGNDPTAKDEAIVIGAHYDHLGYGEYGSLYTGTDKQIHHGADDNASGDAGVMELAQKFASIKNTLKHDIVFMLFSGEEAGLLGSSYFTNSEKFKDMNIIAMLNMDMIGRLKDDKLVIYGTGSSPIWETMINNINKNYNFDITYDPAGFGRSDHASFYAHNVPSIHVFTGSHEDYHKPSDTYEKLDYDGEAKVLNLMYDIAAEIDNETTKPEFTKAPEDNKETQPMGNVRVHVGTIPDYAYDGKGMKLSGVQEGGPADQGGMQAGDIIIKFGEKDVENIYDFMYAMGMYKPDEEVDFIVLRDGKEVTLKVKLGRR